MRERITINLKYETEAQKQMMLDQIFHELIAGYRTGWNTDATTKHRPIKFNYDVKDMIPSAL